MDETSLERMRDKLHAQRLTLFRSVARVEEDLRWLETDRESEREERGQDENMIRLLARLDDRQKAEIDDIDQALRRIAMGTYGRCETCGRPILSARLEALPTTTLCVECAQARGESPA